jgi:hypothetical protein
MRGPVRGCSPYGWDQLPAVSYRPFHISGEEERESSHEGSQRVAVLLGGHGWGGDAVYAATICEHLIMKLAASRRAVGLTRYDIGTQALLVVALAWLVR